MPAPTRSAMVDHLVHAHLEQSAFDAAAPLFADNASVAQVLYTAMDALPCRCTRRWDEKQKAGYRVTQVCSRCRALALYRLVHHLDADGEPIGATGERASTD